MRLGKDWFVASRESVMALCWERQYRCLRELTLYNPTGHYMCRQLCTVCTASCGYYMYRQSNIQQFYVLPTQCIFVFCVDLRTNSDYFPIKH
jgi:hypothetical protein